MNYYHFYWGGQFRNYGTLTESERKKWIDYLERIDQDGKEYPTMAAEALQRIKELLGGGK